MKLYLQLVRLFLGVGIVFGMSLGIFTAIATNWTVGLAYGCFSGVLIALGVPLFLAIAGRKNRAAVDGGK